MSTLTNITSRHLQYEYSSRLKLLHICKLSNYLREYPVLSTNICVSMSTGSWCGLPDSTWRCVSPCCTFLSVGNLLSITKWNVKLTDSPSENYKSSFYHTCSGRVSRFTNTSFYHVVRGGVTFHQNVVLRVKITVIPPFPKWLLHKACLQHLPQWPN